MYRIGTDLGRWIAICALSLSGLSQQATASQGIQFANLSVEDGLTQTSVQAIIQDHRGFIWLGTQEGLNRFDGREFLHFLHDGGNADTLAHNWIWTLHEDRQGRIWIGTGGGGLDRLDPTTGAVKHFPHLEDDTASIGGNVVRDIVEDRDGYLWIGSDGGGIARIDPHTDTVVRLEDLAAGNRLSDNSVRVMHADADGTIWVGTDGGGIHRLDPEDGSVERMHFDATGAADRIRAIATRGTELWVGTYENGLLRLDTASGSTRRFVHDAGDPHSLSGNSIRSLFFDDQGILWVGTDGQGLSEFLSDREGFRRYRHKPTDTSSLADDHVVELNQDRGGVIWVGTYRGISRWNPRVGNFVTVARHGDGENQLSDNYVTSLAETGDGAVWVGTYGGGLNRWDREQDRFSHFTHDPADPTSLPDDRVFALEAADDALWVGTRGGALSRLDLASGRFRRFPHDPADERSLSADGVTSILRDRRGTVWIGTFVAGLNRLDDAGSGTFTRYRHEPGDPHSLCSDRVLALAEDTGGRGIWIGTYGGGLCRLDLDTGEFTWYRHDPGDPDSLASDRAWSVHEDPAGNLWIGTQDAGLDVWRAEDRRRGRARFSHYGPEQGLGESAVYAAQSDAQGNIWFSTNRGLARLEPGSGTIRRYDVTRGLQSNEFNHGAHGRTAEGELMFGGIAGFNIFRPESIRINEHPPQIAFTRISRLNHTMDYREWSGDALAFGHRDVLVSFEYAALDFTAPKRNRYRHRLIGFDADWMEDGDVRRATYTNLAPGAYTLEVSAANSDGVWTEVPLRLGFTVRPAPWLSPWAISGYVLLAMTLLALLYRSYMRRIAVAAQIQQTNDALRAEVRQRERQQQALITAKEQSQRYLEVVEVMIVSLDESGVIRLINPKGLRVLGYNEEDLLGHDFYQTIVPAEHREAVRTEFSRVKDHAYTESPVVTRDGNQRLVAWHVVALPATDDQPAGLLVSGMDLTQERSLERQVREAQKLEALGTLARGIAHDFNNILSAILGFAELVRDEVSPRSLAAGYLQDLEVSVERARGLIRSILTFGRQSRAEAVPTLVQTLVEEALALLRPTIPAGVRIDSHCDERTPPVIADPTQLHQLVMNLATNAVQAMGEGGGTLTLEVSSREVSLDEARTRPGLRPGSYVVLEVDDTGPGMNEETRARMFEPFFTTKEPSRGTGLGLAVVHGLVTQMEGDISVDSAPGAGTHITVLLPATEDVLPASWNGTPRVTDTSGAETVLLVDDEPVLVDLGRAVLEPLGYTVVSANTGAEALSELARLGGIDVVVTDQNMPGMSGVALARAVRDQYGDVPVILMSGAHDPDGRDAAVTARLEKPFKLNELAEMVRLALDGR